MKEQLITYKRLIITAFIGLGLIVIGAICGGRMEYYEHQYKWCAPMSVEHASSYSWWCTLQYMTLPAGIVLLAVSLIWILAKGVSDEAY